MEFFYSIGPSALRRLTGVFYGNKTTHSSRRVELTAPANLGNFELCCLLPLLRLVHGAGACQVFCPRCGDLFFPSGYVRACDGAFWGTTLPHLVLLGWPELRIAPNTRKYVPRIFGFKVYAGTLDPGAEGVCDGSAHRDGHRAGLL